MTPSSSNLDSLGWSMKAFNRLLKVSFGTPDNAERACRSRRSSRTIRTKAIEMEEVVEDGDVVAGELYVEVSLYQNENEWYPTSMRKPVTSTCSEHTIEKPQSGVKRSQAKKLRRLPVAPETIELYDCTAIDRAKKKVRFDDRKSHKASTSHSSFLRFC